MQSKKISDLTACEIIEGLYTIGVDGNNDSCKVSLEWLLATIKAAAGTTANAAVEEAASAAAAAVETLLKTYQSNAESAATSAEQSVAQIDALPEIEADLAAKVDATANEVRNYTAGKKVWGKLTVEEIECYGPTTFILSGEGQPTTAPDFVGQKYIDTTNKAEYTAFGNTSTSDWQPIYTKS